jgi:NAD(P)-dependent dehydrogenase (short-subunit alcohol dehydrogenase family)
VEFSNMTQPVLDLSGRVFVVTGGNGGIGLGMAEGIVQAGGAIAIWSRNALKNAAAVARLEELGGRAASFVCDVSSEEQVIDSMDRSIDALGRIDGLFANAGRGAKPAAFEDIELADWRAVLEVNLDGVFLCLREATRRLIAQGEGGSLVAVSSTSAIHGAPQSIAYGAAKTAVNGLVRALAVGLARHRIRVNSLLPGWTITELAGKAYSNDVFREVTTKRTPVRRWADPAEFRAIGAFLADPRQTFHTGQAMTVDGGYTIF